MSPLVQNVVALLLCFVAAAYVSYRAWRAIRGRRQVGCASGCAACPSSSATARPKLVLIEPPQRH